MIYANSYITSPIVRSKSIKTLSVDYPEGLAKEDEVSRETQPEWLKHKRRELAERYASMTNKQSPNAINIMETLKKLIALDMNTLHNKTRRYSSHSFRNSSSCPRCNGFGMGQFRHIQNGACFCCGKLP
jgi:hypothetical protein